MIINGKQKRNLFEFVDCKVVIKYGKLQRVWFASEDLVHGFLPKNRTDFEFEKYSTARAEFYPNRYNYLLTYESDNGTEQVFLKLNWFKVWQMRFASRRTLLQSKDIKMEVLKYLVVGAIAWTLGSFSIKKCASYEKNQANESPTAIDSIVKNVSSKTKDSVPLTDSLQVD